MNDEKTVRLAKPVKKGILHLLFSRFFIIILLLAVQIIVYSGLLNLPMWPFWIAAFAFPAFLIARNIPERRTYFNARRKLEAAGFAKPDAALFRMTAPEIRILAGTPDTQVESFLTAKSDAELRWQIIMRRFRTTAQPEPATEPAPTGDEP